MNTSNPVLAPLSRLLWKEYRAQRTLWLTMLGLGLGLQGLIYIVFRNPIDLVPAVWSMAAVIQLLCMIASTAIMFAGEREEGTSDWLLRLCAPPVWTLVAKWGFLLLASTAIASILSLTALLLVRIGPGGSDGSLDRGNVFTDVLMAAAGVFIWSSLGSLLSRRVLTSIPTMAFWWIITMVLPVSLVPWLFGFRGLDVTIDRFEGQVMVFFTVVAGAADLWLGWRWCHGKYADARILANVHQKWNALLNRILRRSTSASRLPTCSEDSYVGRRIWQRLLWQERHRDSFHRMLLQGGCAISLLVGLTRNSEALFVCVSGLVIVLPMFLGVLSFRYDAEGQPLRFLANRGVSAGPVWFAKQTVWLPRAFWVPFIISMTGGFSAVLSAAYARSELVVLPAYLLTNSIVASWNVHWKDVETAICFVLVTYSCGQLAAMLLRQTILSVVVGVVLSGIATFWLVLMRVLDVPLWWSVGGVSVWFFWLSWWYAPYWLMERRSRRIAAGLGFNVLVPFMTLIGVTAAWRVGEVDGFHPVAPVAPPATSDEMSWELKHPHHTFALELQRVIAWQSGPLTADDLATSRELCVTLAGVNHWWELRKANSEKLDPEHVAPPEAQSDEQLKQHFRTINAERIQRVLAVAGHERRVIKDVDGAPSTVHSLESSGSTWKGMEMPQIALMRCSADLLTEAGDMDQALDHYRAALRLASYWAARGSLSQRWWNASNSQILTWSSLVNWSNHPNQTASKLKLAMEHLRREWFDFPSAQEAAVAQYLNDSRLLDGAISERWIRSTSNDPVGSYGSPFLLLKDTSRFFPWETTRAHRMLEQQLVERYRAISKATEDLPFAADVSRILDDPNWSATKSAQLFRSTYLLHQSDRFLIEPRPYGDLEPVLSREVC